MTFQEDLELHLNARIPVVNIVTSEEARILAEVRAMCRNPSWPAGEGLYTWDIADQFTCLVPAKIPFDHEREATPDTILRMIRDYAGGATFVLKDFHQVWEARRGVIRGLRNLAASLPESSPRKNVLIITPEPSLPAELQHEVPVLELAKPDAGEMDALLEHSVGATGALQAASAGLRAKLVEAALGLTSTQARRVFQKAVVASRDGRLDERCIDLIVEEKRAIIRGSGALELYPYVERPDRVGGLEALKDWLERRRLAFSEGARDYGLDPRRGPDRHTRHGQEPVRQGRRGDVEAAPAASGHGGGLRRPARLLGAEHPRGHANRRDHRPVRPLGR
jgi:hypothetical protein